MEEVIIQESETPEETTQVVAEAPAENVEATEVVEEAPNVETAAVVEGNQPQVAEETVVAETTPAIEETTPVTPVTHVTPETPETPAMVEPEVVELAPDAIADILGLGAGDSIPTTTTAAAPVPTPIAETKDAPAQEVVTSPVVEATNAESAPESPESPETTEVSRSEEDFVGMEVYRGFEAEVRSLVGDVSSLVENTNTVIDTLNETISSQSEIIRSLTTRLEALEADMQKSAGRRGMVARSFTQEEATERELKDVVSKEQYERIIKELVASGQGHVATEIIMGWKKIPTARINDPLLPGQGADVPLASAATASDLAPSSSAPQPLNS